MNIPSTPMIDLPVALNQQQGRTRRMGFDHVAASRKASELANKRLDSIRVATAASQTPPPTTIRSTVAKLAANDASPAREDIVAEVLPAVLVGIKQGGTGIKAAKAMKTQYAINYANCKKAMKGASQKDRVMLNAIERKNSALLSKLKLITEHIAYLEKEIAIYLKQNEPDLLLRAQSRLGDVLAEQSKLSAQIMGNAGPLSAQMKDPRLVNCLIDAVIAEGRLLFETKEGSELKSVEAQIAEADLPPEEVVELAESGEILEQAADQGVEKEEGLVAQTAFDKRAMSKEGLFTPKNLIIGSIALGALYLVFMRK